MSSPTLTADAPRGASLEKLERLRVLQERMSQRERLRLARVREALLSRCPHPLALAQELDPRVVSTPAIELISRQWVDTLHAHDGRCTTSLGPQQGKSALSRWLVFWALLENPDRRVVFASHSMLLARTSGRLIRHLVAQYGRPFGLRLDQSHHDAADWQLAGYLGGCLSASIESTLTGRPSDVMVLDDLLSGEAQALSPTIRARVETWWESTARVRMAPGAPAISIGTRWSEDDILSRFISEGWVRINIPALADGQTLDSVADLKGARTENGYLVSTRGTTEQDWETKRREEGERAWHALEQGNPSPPEGGLFMRAWFEDHRVGVDGRPPCPPLTEIAVGVDPADTGTGDEAGVVVAGRARDGHLYVLADYSGMLSQAQWARTAVMAWLERDASKIVVERNLGVRSSIPDAWSLIRRQAKALASAGSVEAAMSELQAAGDEVAADVTQLEQVAPWVEDVVSRPSSGPRQEIVTPKQSKIVRAQSVTGLFETGRAHIVGRLPALEHECITWLGIGSHSPARIDVLAHLLTRLEAVNVTSHVATPAGSPRLPTRSGASSPTARPAGVSAPSLPRRAGAGRR